MNTGATSHHVLEITVISGEDLFVSRRRVKRNAFVVLRTDRNSSSQRTKIDKDGGSYPLWNDKFNMNFPMHARHINIEVQCKTASGNSFIGSVNIPKTDFLGGYVPHGYLHFLSYRLRDRRGKRNGIINISVRVKRDEKVGLDYGFSNPCSSVMPVDYKVSTSIVMGVPIN
ncbi:hypothetical protein LIER_25624 [Lithospermum erythrorhizon]|uniref:C2 domain-containing protein n=1 Tax=Lithospermum erythrorhizon TaxID=34254 RepID=A0AAV3R5P5_LITER